MPAFRRSDGTSRNDVRGELILDVGDAVAQMQLAFFEPLDLQLIRAAGVLQGQNGGVEVAMLLLQSRQLLLQLTLFFFCHRYRRLLASCPR